MTLYISAVVLMAFLMPIYPQSLGFILGFIAVLYFAQRNKLRSLQIILHQKTIWCSLFLWLLYLISILYSGDKTEALGIFPTKSALFLFPIIFSPLILDNEYHLNKLKLAFIYGCMLSVVINIALAGYYYTIEYIRIQQNLYVENYGINFFLSSRLSRSIHPGYWAMYLNWALALLLFTPSLNLRQGIKYAALFILVLGIVLSASKSGLISIMLLMFGLIFVKIRRQKKVSSYLKYIVLGSLLIPLTLFHFAPEYSKRFINVLNIFNHSPMKQNTNESTALRLVSWNASVEIIKSHPIMGVGLGDVRSELKQIYKKEKQEVAYNKALNSHNQFLQTSVTLGMLGLLALLGILFFFISRFFIYQNITGIMLGFLVFINLMFESMLEAQAGIIFIFFWMNIELAQLLRGQK